ncbi:uncharacterized protein LOC129245889 [Anastrepha obliqua]|uniref:uncharacterized protein LOC129245889 n=1 Tax=Anastrepha obliqua TaxID=95512 RepID=UPI00240A3463|nr:uncharacterized protein LOC129245889 [Anastrepha obliqua]
MKITPLRMQFCVRAIVIFCTLSIFAKAEQPYTVKNEDFEHFDGMKETISHWGEMKIIGRQRFMNGTLKFAEDMNNEHYKFSVEVFSSPQGDDQFKRLPLGLPPTNICDVLKNLYTKQLQPSLVQGKNTNFPYVPEDEGLCPVPKGEYYVKELELNTDSWPNQIPHGLLKVVFTFFKDEINVGGGVLLLKVEERK